MQALEDLKDSDLKVDLTPMIDVVFLLIIFFMIVTRINEDKLELLTLPQATQAVADDGNAMRLIINVDKDGTVKINGRRYKFSDLENVFEAEVKLVDVSLAAAKQKNGSDLGVLLRADVDTQYYHIQEIIRKLSSKYIFKLDLACQNNN